jgi:hypothetical protein
MKNDFLLTLNGMVHQHLMDHGLDTTWVCIPDYSGSIELSWQIANKVKLFDDIIIVKGGRRWVAFRKGVEQPLLFGDEDRPIDFLELKPIAMGNSFPETICRAALVLQKERNEQANRSNQHSDREYPQVSS